MNKEDKTLVKRAQRGEAEAFGVLYNKHLTPIYRFIFLRVRNRADAEDLSHQVFMNAWQNIQNYRFQGFPFSSWLYKIASNAVIDHWRTKKNNVSIDFVAESFLSESPELGDSLDKKQDVKIVKAALTKLEPEHQNILIMRFVNELSNKEIAHVLDKSEGAVRVIQHRAIKKLKTHLDGENNPTIKNA